MRVQVEIFTGKCFVIEVGDDSKVEDLKRLIGEQENLPTASLILLLYDKEENQGTLMVEGDTSLVDYGVQDGSLVYLFFTLPPLDDDHDPFAQFPDMFSSSDTLLGFPFGTDKTDPK